MVPKIYRDLSTLGESKPILSLGPVMWLLADKQSQTRSLISN